LVGVDIFIVGRFKNLLIGQSKRLIAKENFQLGKHLPINTNKMVSLKLI
jgi:hypothetical protein